MTENLNSYKHLKNKEKRAIKGSLYLMADGRGFEPPLGFRPKRTFQARAFNHSATHPLLEKWSYCT